MDVSSVSALASDYSSSSTAQSSDALAALLRRANMGPTHPSNSTVSLAQIQTVNIRAHVHIILDLENTSYSQWRRLFDTVFGKFGLRDHVDTAATPRFSDSEWAMIDECIINWLYTTISTDLLDAVMEKDNNVLAVWTAIEELFHDNCLTSSRNFVPSCKAIFPCLSTTPN